MNYFEPIAIIGQSCLFPQAFSPAELWQLSMGKRDCFSEPAADWLVDPKLLINHSPNFDPDHPWSLHCGYLRGFEQIFDPSGFAMPAEEIQGLSSVFQWPLHLARQALLTTKYDYQQLDTIKTGAIFANLCYPTLFLLELTLQNWLQQQEPALHRLFTCEHDWRNRFNAGLPAHILAKALKLSGRAFTLDAACGSTMYAIKLACNQLQSRRADLMLAGGINAIDEIFVAMGFLDLHALSRTGQSLPFDRHADGLVPTQGGSFFVLKRLQDAIRDQDTISGVIRGIGLSDDGTAGGLLVPSVAGQVLAMQRAYAAAQINPKTISFIECHATGTPVGDAIELRGLKELFTENNQLVLGALKSNLGHSLTTSTGAALVRVLSAFQHQLLPPIKSLADPIDELKTSNFTVLQEPLSWSDTADNPLRAAINGFGLGGTNAHLIVEQWQANAAPLALSPATTAAEAIAIVAMGSIVGELNSSEELADHLFSGTSIIRDKAGVKQARIKQIELPADLHFPPNELKQALGQQLSVLQAALQAMAKLKQPGAGDRTGIYIGINSEPEIARRSFRSIFPYLFVKKGIQVPPKWIEEALNAILAEGSAGVVLGGMPNIVASRLAIQWNCRGPAYALASEELSGIAALQIAQDALQAGELDMAIVGAVDISCDPLHEQASKAVLSADKQIPGDAAVVLILKRLQDAQQQGEKIIAVLGQPQEEDETLLKMTETSYSHLFGHSHAASGLLHLALAAMAVDRGLLAAPKNKTLARPWLPNNQEYQAELNIEALGGQRETVYLKKKVVDLPQPFIQKTPPRLYCYAGDNPQQLLAAIQNNQQSWQGPSKLVILAESAEQLAQRKVSAIELLNKPPASASLPHLGIYYREQPLPGEIALVFATSNTAYPDMGLPLALAFPDILAKMQTRYPQLQKIIDLLYRQKFSAQTFVDETLVNFFLSMLHYAVLHDVLGIKPDAIMGHSLGESSALGALGIFEGLDKIHTELIANGLFDQQLGGEYQALRHYYPNLRAEEIAWQNWRVAADVNLVKQLLAAEEYCHLTIINTANDVVISGLPQVCERIIKTLNPAAAAKLKLDFIVHCPELHAVADEWYRLHHQVVYPQPVRFYSCISGKPYPLTSDAVAENMLKLGTSVVDFPRLIDNAWQDGVRKFIEVGPQRLCSQWINKILGDKPHLAAHLDQPGRSSLTQLMHAMAELLVAGVELDYAKFSQRVHPHE